jgi:hypothetical protein
LASPATALSAALGRIRRNRFALGHHGAGSAAERNDSPLPCRNQALPSLFIGLLGDRYGWVPEREDFSSTLLNEEGWLEEEINKQSVTELEILHGVLNNPDMAGRAFFFCLRYSVKV